MRNNLAALGLLTALAGGCADENNNYYAAPTSTPGTSGNTPTSTMVETTMVNNVRYAQIWAEANPKPNLGPNEKVELRIIGVEANGAESMYSEHGNLPLNTSRPSDWRDIQSTATYPTHISVLVGGGGRNTSYLKLTAWFVDGQGQHTLLASDQNVAVAAPSSGGVVPFSVPRPQR